MGRSTSNFPSSGARAVTPHDTNLLANGTCRSLYIGVTGDVSVLTSDGDVAVVFKAVPVGVLPIQCQRVNSTGTTATNILALY